MKKAYISRNYKDITGAGGKAKTDIEWIICKGGYKLDRNLAYAKIMLVYGELRLNR